MAWMDLPRRLDPFVRPAFDATLRQPLTDVVQWLKGAGRSDDGLGLADERSEPDEDATTKEIIEVLAELMERTYEPGAFLRAGNTKTYAVVHGSLKVHKGLPKELRHGLFARSKTYPAWVRFAGPGPFAPPDIRDPGVLSIGVKLMDVPGRKLMGSTVDLTALSTPTTTTASLSDNLRYRHYLVNGRALGYFLNPLRPRLADLMMLALYARTHANPLDATYWSCVPYLLGAGQAMKYRLTPTVDTHTGVPWNPPDDYLRQAMIRTLADQTATFDLAIQRQTDARRMPIEDATIIWPEHLSPHQTVATLTIPPQAIDPAEQFQLADQLTYNPWHTLTEHRPLGNQNRARRTVYHQLAQLRQLHNDTASTEPRPPRA